MSDDFRKAAATLPPEEQERRVLRYIETMDGGIREDIMVELRPAFDRVVAKGLIGPSEKFYITEEGRALVAEKREKP